MRIEVSCTSQCCQLLVEVSPSMGIDARQQNDSDNSVKLQSTKPRKEEALPDVSRAEKTEYAGVLSRVGMGDIEMPILFTATDGTPINLPAKVDAFVSLDDAEAKGIHMSRLYIDLKNSFRMKPLTAETLKEVLVKFLRSHAGLSENAYLTVRFILPLERKALLSHETGFRQYPVEMRASLKGEQFDFSMGVDILYSSTCPCSTALARQLVKEDFLSKFGAQEAIHKNDVLDWLEQEPGAVATPHAQRSLAKIKIRLQPGLKSPSIIELIDRSEKALGTPVQAAVKRVDEQEFAKLNSENLMFCEDAARKLRNFCEGDKRISDYSIYVEHQESLHPHNAISKVFKGDWENI